MAGLTPSLCVIIMRIANLFGLAPRSSRHCHQEVAGEKTLITSSVLSIKMCRSANSKSPSNIMVRSSEPAKTLITFCHFFTYFCTCCLPVQPSKMQLLLHWIAHGRADGEALLFVIFAIWCSAISLSYYKMCTCWRDGGNDECTSHMSAANVETLQIDGICCKIECLF